MKKIITLSILIASISLLSGCGKNDSKVVNTFGEFSYKGITLIANAVNTITADQAKDIINNNSIQSTNESIMLVEDETVDPEQELPEVGEDDDDVPSEDLTLDKLVMPSLPSSLVDAQLYLYSHCNIVTYYYESHTLERLNKTDIIQGGNLTRMLINNEYSPYGQLEINSIIMIDEILDIMKLSNDLFRNQSDYNSSPFRDIYTFHTNAQGNLVVQIHQFEQIDASISGGISSSFRQDIELVYDEHNKLTHWQASLGIYTATPSGTLQEGYIFESTFEWVEKTY